MREMRFLFEGLCQARHGWSSDLTVVGNVLHVQVVVSLVDGGGGGGGAAPAPLLLSLRPLLVGLDVFVEVVRPREPLPALLAHEPLLPGVGPEVPLELV